MTPRLPTLSSSYRASAREAAPAAGPIPVRRPFIGAALFTFVVAAMLAVLWGAPAPALDTAAWAVEWLRGRNDLAGQASVTVVLVAAAALAFVVAWSRASDPRRPVRVPGGRGTIAVDEVAAWLRDAIEVRTDIRSVAVVVHSQGKGVRVAAQIAVTADARLQETSKGARAAIEQVLATQVGVPMVADPIIELRYEELRLRPRALGRESQQMEQLTHADA